MISHTFISRTSISRIGFALVCLLSAAALPSQASRSQEADQTFAVIELHSSRHSAMTRGSLEQQWVSAIANDQAARLSDMLSTENAPTLVPLRSSNGKSALMVACKAGDLALAKRLVDLDADVNAETATGGTSFMFAVLGDHLEISRWLHSQSVFIDARGSNGWTAMTIAAAKGQVAMLRWLLSIGADATVSDVYRFTPLMRAVDNGHLSSARLLIESEKVDVHARDELGNSSLHHATANGDLPMVKLLLSAGADAGQANRAGITAADIARASDASQSLLALLVRG